MIKMRGTKKEKNMSPDADVPVLEKMAFSVGGQGANFFIMIIGSFLLVYYTNVVGVGAGIVATIIGISKVLDGLSDLVAGYILDRTHTKYGKCRPWLIRMILPTAISMILMLWVPGSFPSIGKAVYIFVTYNLSNTVCLTMLSVAHAALNGSMSLNQKDRGLNGGFMMLFGIVGGLILNSTVLQITTAVGGGDPYTQKGWTAMIVIYSIVFVVLTLFNFFGTTERVTMAQWKLGEEHSEKQKEQERKPQSKIGVIESFRILLHDKYWVIFVLLMLCVVVSQTSSGMSNLYFTQYVLGDVLIYTPLANFSSIGAIVGALSGLVMMKKLKKRNIGLVGLVFMVVGVIIPVLSLNQELLYVSGAFKGVGTGIMACILPGMLQDAISYAQWQSGKDVLGMGNAAYSFCNKLGGSLGTIVMGWILEFAGFSGTLAVQSASAITAIRTLYIWIPLVTTLLTIVCMVFYDLDNKFDKISEELKASMGCTDKE